MGTLFFQRVLAWTLVFHLAENPSIPFFSAAALAFLLSMVEPTTAEA